LFLGIDYSPEGQPFLAQNSSCVISISHSKTWHAMLFYFLTPQEKANNSQIKIGIDIEKISPKVKKVAHKFLTPPEQALLNTFHTDLAFTLAWSAKETIIKMFGKNLQMRSDIQIESIDTICQEICVKTNIYKHIILKFDILHLSFVLVKGIYFI
jgi:phosphopantetheine--protein transferase-like protein